MTSAPPRIPRHRPMFADTVPAPRCSGPCAQGRRACPTPAACQCGDDDDTGLPGPAMSAVIAVAEATDPQRRVAAREGHDAR